MDVQQQKSQLAPTSGVEAPLDFSSKQNCGDSRLDHMKRQQPLKSETTSLDAKTGNLIIRNSQNQNAADSFGSDGNFSDRSSSDSPDPTGKKS